METFQRNANRGSISTGYDIDNSMKCQANSGNEWFYRDNPTAGNRQTFTFSFWFKRSQLEQYEADNYLMSQGSNARFHFAGHTIRFMFDGNSTEMEASGNLRDTAAWYHIVLAIDTTQGTNTNRVKAYVNGVQYPFNNNDWPSQNATSDWMNTNDMYFNTRDGDGSYDNSGYWAEIAVVDGQQLAPTDFGEFDEDSGIWKPKDLSSITFGSEGFWWNFSNSSSLGEDSSGNSNTATFNNLTTADLATDTPTNNFATLNPLHMNSGTSGFSNQPIHTEGATIHTSTLADYWQTSIATIGVTSGKWYFEAKIQDSNTTLVTVGVGDEGDIITWGINNGYLGDGKSVSYSSGSSAYTHSNIIGIAVDVDNGKIYWAKDNTYINSGDPAGNSNGTALPTGGVSNGTYFLGVSGYKLNGHAVWQVNFGGHTAMTISSAATDTNGYGTFEYAPPSGFYALCTKNLAEYGG